MVSRKDSRVGETIVAKNGLKMTIIGYRNCNDLDIQFEDGYTLYHRHYRSFLSGKVKHPDHSAVKTDRVGETNTNKQGQVMTIIGYRNAHDIDIQLDTGEVFKGKSYDNFKKGKIACPTGRKIVDKSGETSIANNGMKLTLIAYRGTHDVDVQFEDGYICQNVRYYSFVTGRIRHPGTQKNANASKRHIGETAISKHGKTMKIIRWGNKFDIDIEFEDGYVSEHKRYGNFVRGAIAHPDDVPYQFADKTGITGMSTKGQKMTVEVYRSSHDIDIRFEDGTLVTHKKYRDFQKGLISNPNYRVSKHTGKTIISKDGIQVKVVDAIGDKAYLQYETGYTTTRDRKEKALRNYRLRHPYPYQMQNITIEAPAYIHNGVGNFYCRCNNCHKADIMTIQEARDHICQNS